MSPGNAIWSVDMLELKELINSNVTWILNFVMTLLVILITRFVWRKLTKHPPGPFPFPLCGNHFNIGRASVPIYRVFGDLKKRFGPVYSLSLLREKVVIVHGHELIREALVNPSESVLCRAQDVAAVYRKTGILWRSGPDYEKLRKLTLTSLQDLGSTRYGVEERLLDNVQGLIEELIASMEQPVKTRNLIERVVLNMLCDVLFGVRYNSDDNQFLLLHNSLDTLSTSPATSFPACARLYVPIIPTFLQAGSQKRLLSEAESTLHGIILSRLKDHKFGLEIRKPKDVMDMFIKMAQKNKDQTLSDESITCIISDMLQAGYQTTSACMLWVILYLLRNPDVQDTCRQDIMEKIGSDRLVLMKDREKMTYIQAVICEVQRIASIEPLSLPYRAEASTNIGGYTVPRSSVLLFNLQSAHMDSSYWKRPTEFRPSHFLDMDRKVVKHDAFFPFGIGERSCVGENLATVQIFLLITNILRRFKLLLPFGESVPRAERDNINGRQPLPYSMCAVSARV